MKTSQQWWDEVKLNPTKLNDWLQRQCYGERKAYERITELSEKFNNPVLKTIADQELTHYQWIKSYLQQNNVEVIDEHSERYWKEVPLEFDTLEKAAAVGHHAETMRLDRIRVIAKDTLHPELATIFKAILKDEIFHAKAFESLSDEQSLEIAKIDHKQGMLALGLTV